MHSRKNHLRLRKWVKPRLQLKLIGSFLALSFVAVVLQFMLFSTNVMRLAKHLPFAEDYTETLVGDMLRDTMLIAIAVLIPLSLLVGGLVTHRIAGPVYRFERYLEEVAAGTQIGPCKIRERDELHELCTAINRATESIRLRPRGTGGFQRDPARPGTAEDESLRAEV
jgi:signal peptidase II